MAQIATITGLSMDQIQTTTTVINDLDMDSLELVELLVWADEHFPGDLTPLFAKSSWKEVTVADLIEYFHRPA